MQKLYSRINWENYPSEQTPLNESNLNKLDAATDGIDNRVISLNTSKFDKSAANNLIADWHIDEKIGIITITKLSGSKIMFDLNIEKIPVGFTLSPDGILTMTTDDGTKFTANIGAMIPVLTFSDSDTIAVSVSGTGVNKAYSFTVKNGSITEDMMDPNYLADIKVDLGQAEADAIAAAGNANAAAAEILQRAERGEFDGKDGKDGAPGGKGDKGDPGASGIQVTGNAIFTIYTDTADNCAIHVVYDDGLGEPPLKYDPETGAIYWQYEVE